MAENWMLKAVLSANADGMLKTLKSVNIATKNTRKYLLDVASSAGNLAGQIGLPLGLIGGALSAFSVAGVQQAVANFAALGDEVVKSAQRIGMGTAEYQRLKYTATQSGVSVDGLASSMGRLNKGIAMAAAGKNKDLASLFARAGISMRDANGKLRSSADLLPEVADLFARNGNAAVQARMGNAIFGKSWQELAPLLQGGGKGIDELNERYKMLGLTVDHDALKAGEAFGDQMSDMQQVVGSYGNAISAKLLPALSPLIEKTIQWAVENRELITTNVSAFITDLTTSLAAVDWTGVINGVKDFFKGCKELIDQLGGAKNALIALVLFMNLNSIMAFFGLIGAVGRLIWSLGVLSVTAIPKAIIGMGTLGGAITTVGTKANLLLGALSNIAAVAGAGFLGYQIGGLLNDYVINPSVQMLTGDKDATLGTAIYDLFNPEAAQPSLVGNQQSKVGGEITVKFDNAPSGMRVEQSGAKGPVALNTDVGYRSFATGMAY